MIAEIEQMIAEVETMSIGHHQWSGNIPHEGPLEECEWCNPKLRKREVEAMSDDIVARLRANAAYYSSMEASGPAYDDSEAADALERKDAEIERLTAEVEEWRECARYDPTMSGESLFKGWDRSQMDRCRKRYLEANALNPKE